MKKFYIEAKKMIRINSVSANGNEELANYVQSLLHDRGLKTSMQLVTHSRDDISKRQFNVLGILGDPLVDKKSRKGLLLNTHLDTVSPGINENWTETGGDPFEADMKDGKIFGLGSADVKLDFLCKLYAVGKFREEKLKQPIYLVGTCGEEIGMLGAKYLIKSGALNPKFVLVGEPSELKVVYAHKCLNIFKVSIGCQLVERDARGFNRRIDMHSLGRSAHSSYPHLGQNAIVQALEVVQKAIDRGFEFRFTKLAGGDTVNKVPDRALFQFYVTSHQFEDFKRYFREILKGENREKSFRVELGGVGDSGVKFLPEPIFGCLNQVVEHFKSLGLELEKTSDESYSPAFSTMNFGQLIHRLGGIDLYFDLRVLPQIPEAEVEKKVKEGIQKIAAQFPSLNVSVTKERTNPGLNMTVDHELVRICQEAMKDAKMEPLLNKKATSTEAALYFQAGYESVIFGPGVSQGNSHSPNEHNLIDQVEKATMFYTKLIERVCL